MRPMELVREPSQHIPGVAVMDADGGELGRLDLAEQARHAIDERLAADEANVRMMLRLPKEMLARAEADLEPNVGNGLREQSGERGGRRLGEGKAQSWGAAR